MPVDPEIALKLNPPPQALDTLGRFATIQNTLNQNQLFQQTFAARQRAGQILAGADPNDPEAGIRGLMSDPQTAPFAGEIINSMRQAQATLLSMQGEQQKQAQSGLEGFMKALPAVMADPSQWKGTVDSQMATLSPTARQRVAPAIESLRLALTEGLPSDQAQARAVFNQRLSGQMIAAGVTPESIRAIVGTPTTQDVGGQILSGVQAPPQLGGGFTPSTSAGKTLPPTLTTGPYGPGGAETPVVLGGGQGNPLGLEARGAIPAPSGTAQPSLALPVPGSGVIPATAPVTAPSVSAPATPVARPALSGPSMTQAKYLTDRGTDMAEYQKELDANTKTGGLIMQTLSEARDALASAKPGGGASAYAKLAQFAQAVGAPADVVDKIGNGDLGASQEFNKLMVNTTMGQIRAQLNGVGASRLSQMEFQTFQQNNPNIETDPRAIEKIFNFWTKLYQRDHAEQGELNKYLAGGGDISEWPAKWQDMAQQRGYIHPEITNKTAPSGGGATKRWDPALGKLVPIQ